MANWPKQYNQSQQTPRSSKDNETAISLAQSDQIISYHGRIKTTQDALLLLEACRQHLIPTINRRLTSFERSKYILPNTIFIWNESTCGMKRWTDGKIWSPSKVHNGNFLIYKELNKFNQKLEENGLIKQSFSLTTKDEQKYHIISYYLNPIFSKAGNSSGTTVENVNMVDGVDGDVQVPSKDAALAHLKLSNDHYPGTMLQSVYNQHFIKNPSSASTTTTPLLRPSSSVASGMRSRSRSHSPVSFNRTPVSLQMSASSHPPSASSVSDLASPSPQLHATHHHHQQQRLAPGPLQQYSIPQFQLSSPFADRRKSLSHQQQQQSQQQQQQQHQNQQLHHQQHQQSQQQQLYVPSQLQLHSPYSDARKSFSQPSMRIAPDQQQQQQQQQQPQQLISPQPFQNDLARNRSNNLSQDMRDYNWPKMNLPLPNNVNHGKTHVASSSVGSCDSQVVDVLNRSWLK
ncbi:uncharacterized protein LODBEIA_P54650 [Lodderomyces beijingensis]|uniref:cAMP-independent regulatory protein pac2 n=1 Tax=Lodderomyces beijingensis TaxID=1775926 RepID=A0ABP0ZVF6_9ASCO